MAYEWFSALKPMCFKLLRSDTKKVHVRRNSDAEYRPKTQNIRVICYKTFQRRREQCRQKNKRKISDRIEIQIFRLSTPATYSPPLPNPVSPGFFFSGTRSLPGPIPSQFAVKLEPDQSIRSTRQRPCTDIRTIR